VSGGWWRRNRWGLAALLPALVAAIGLDVRDGFRHHRDAQPSDPVAAGADGWVTLAGMRMRLAELAPVTQLEAYGGRRYAPPASLKAWRAEIVFDGPAPPGGLLGCRLFLEDDTGRTFDASPAELRGARIPIADCAPQAASAATPPRPGRPEYTTLAYFVTPASARPVAVRLTLTGTLPRFARLTGS
jgi:hypothetical protein